MLLRGKLTPTKTDHSGSSSSGCWSTSRCWGQNSQALISLKQWALSWPHAQFILIRPKTSSNFSLAQRNCQMSNSRFTAVGCTHHPSSFYNWRVKRSMKLIFESSGDLSSSPVTYHTVAKPNEEVGKYITSIS